MKHVSRRSLLKTASAGALVPLVPTIAVAQAASPTLLTNLRATHRADRAPKFDRVVIDLSGTVCRAPSLLMGTRCPPLRLRPR